MISLITVLVSLLLSGEGEHPSPDIVQVTAPRMSAVSGSVATAKLKVTVREGYHIQAASVKEDYLIPTVLTLPDDANFRTESVEFPSGRPLLFDGVEEPWSVLEGTFEIIVTFRIAPVTPGAATARWSGVLRYQACDEKRCFPPVSVEFDLPVEVL